MLLSGLWGCGGVLSMRLITASRRRAVSCSLYCSLLELFTMKRPHQTKVRTLRQLDIRKDLTPEQLAGIGAVAIAYNYAENTINRMIAVVLSLTGNTHIDVVTRIN